MAEKRMMLALDRALFRAGERVCVALSGGADSVALLLALMEANALKDSLGVVLSAVHVNHGLRGAEGDADEGFVLALCERVGVPVVVERVDVRERQAEEREGLEEAARELRYGVFWRLMEAGKVDVVATAHTMDDQAETVVMKLLRGAWTEGIGGIAPVVHPSKRARRGPRVERESLRTHVSESRPFDLAQGGLRAPGFVADREGRVVRPMLAVRRAEVEEFLRERGQDWREDATNRDVSLTRNRVRHELMPVLRGFNPAIDTALARLAEIARDEEAFWQAEVARVLPQMVLPGRPVRGGGRAVSTVTGGPSCAVEIERLRGLAPALRRRVLRAAARGLGCRISAEETAKLLGLAGLSPQRTRSNAAGQGQGMGAGKTPGRVGARLELGHGLRAERTARELHLSVSHAPFVSRRRPGKADSEPGAGE
jgi:tRNA(Ile)-lysidine synthase